MANPSRDILLLFRQALEYDQGGDAYNAVKLYKRVCKMAPDWPDPFFRLGSLYKQRREWKPCLHYYKKTVAIDSTNKEAWWNIGIAATALKKARLARTVWNKFGLSQFNPTPVSVQISYGRQFEILIALQIDPTRAMIGNIPFPASDRRYRDLVLIDKDTVGHHVAQQKKYPVYEELTLFKRSSFRTFSCVLDTRVPKDIEQLALLCKDGGLGFENWSNAARVFSRSSKSNKPEYYGAEFFDFQPEGGTLVALAGKSKKEVSSILKTWQVISLQSFRDLQQHY